MTPEVVDHPVEIINRVMDHPESLDHLAVRPEGELAPDAVDRWRDSRRLAPPHVRSAPAGRGSGCLARPPDGPESGSPSRLRHPRPSCVTSVQAELARRADPDLVRDLRHTASTDRAGSKQGPRLVDVAGEAGKRAPPVVERSHQILAPDARAAGRFLRGASATSASSLLRRRSARVGGDHHTVSGETTARRMPIRPLSTWRVRSKSGLIKKPSTMGWTGATRSRTGDPRCREERGRCRR